MPPSGVSASGFGFAADGARVARSGDHRRMSGGRVCVLIL